MAENRFFIGIDDTDSPSSKGTGYLTRELGKEIENQKLGKVLNITRHQLLISKGINFTNRNNSACIEVNTCNIESLAGFCHHFIYSNTNDEANPVMIISPANTVSESIIEFGIKAKNEILTLKQSEKILKDYGLKADFIRKKKNGIIGALAAIGLRATGNDGRVIWVNGYEMKGLIGNYLAGEVYCETHVDSIKTEDGFKIPINAHINFTDNRIKPVFKENSVILLVEEITTGKIEELSGNNFKAILN